MLSFVFAALGAWTKNEGLAALILLTVLVVAEAVSRGSTGSPSRATSRDRRRVGPVVGAVAVCRRLRPACWVGAFALGQVLVYTVVYVVAPWDIAELLELTATRLLLHVMPAAVLPCVLVVPKAWHAQSLPSRPLIRVARPD